MRYRNSGIAFGLLKNYGSDYTTASLIIVSCVALLLLFYLITQIKRDQNLQTWGLSLVLGGAVGNLIDRFRLGEVVDFLDFHWHSHDRSDELFYVIEGKLFVDFADKTEEVLPGELITVPKGIKHRTRADYRTIMLCFEHKDNIISNAGK